MQLLTFRKRILGVLLTALCLQQQSLTVAHDEQAGTSSNVGWSKDSQTRQQLHIVVLVLIPHSNSPALDLMGVASHLQERGHKVLVVTTSPAAIGYLQRASARHTSNTTAEAMQYIAAEAAAPVAAQGAAMAAAPGTSSQATAGVPTADRTREEQAAMQSQQQGRSSKTAAAAQQTWKVPHSWLDQALVGPRLVVAMQDSMAAACGQVVRNTTVMQTIRDFKPDAILPLVLLPTGPSLATDSCGCLMSVLLGGVPFVEVDAPMATFWINSLNTPQFGSGVSPEELQHPLRHPGAWLRNAAAWLAFQLLPLWLQLSPTPPSHGHAAMPQSYAALRSELLLPPAASFGHLANLLQRLKSGKDKPQRCKPLLRVLPGTWLFEHPRPLQPNHVLTGVGSPRPAQPLTSPTAAAEFVAGAKNGLVLVGFGTGKVSNDSSWLQLLDFRELAFGLAALAPVRVLWNLQGGLPEGTQDVRLGDNTLVVGWVDYNDVLGHPNTRAFVTHCGLHSVYEGMYHGVPLVGVPFMFEQAHTCAKAVRLGAAQVSPEAPAFRSHPHQDMHFTAKGIAGIISKVLNNSSMADAAAGVSRILEVYAARRHPYARAADAVETVVTANRLDRKHRTHHLRQEQQLQQERLRGAAAGAAEDLDNTEL